MVDWKYLLFAQYPACLILAVFFLVKYTRVRKASAVKSILWVLCFGAALACSVLFAFLGVNLKYWTLRSIFSLSLAGWIGVVLIAAALVAHIVHTVEKKRSLRAMEKELRKAEKEKEDAVAQAHEEGRREAQQEAEAARGFLVPDVPADIPVSPAAESPSTAEDTVPPAQSSSVPELTLSGDSASPSPSDGPL